LKLIANTFSADLDVPFSTAAGSRVVEVWKRPAGRADLAVSAMGTVSTVSAFDQRGIDIASCYVCFMLTLDRKLTAKATEVAARRRAR
jgi:hypothetical protein